MILLSSSPLPPSSTLFRKFLSHIAPSVTFCFSLISCPFRSISASRLTSQFLAQFRAYIWVCGRLLPHTVRAPLTQILG
jgi:hypothetical protein